MPAEAADFKPVNADTLTVVTSLPGPGFFEGSDSDPTKVTSGYEYDIAKACRKNSACTSSSSATRTSTRSPRARSPSTTSRCRRSRSRCDRAKVVKFSIPYFQSNQGVLINAGDRDHDARRGQEGPVGRADRDDRDRPARTRSARQAAQVFQTLPDAYTALQAEQIDAVLIDTAINLGEAARSNGKFEVVSQFAQAGGPDQYGAILPKGSTNAGAVNAVLKS